MAVGLNKGHKVTENVSKYRYSASTMHPSPNTPSSFGMSVASCPMSRAMELLKVSKDEHMLQFIKKRVGMHIYTKRKQEELSNMLVTMRKAAAKDW